MTFSILAAVVAASLSGATPDLARGEYLVTRVMLCGDCHTPKGPSGAPIEAKALTGAPFAGGPPGNPNFAHYAPAIAGLPAGRNAAELATLLATGAYPDGQAPRPPMPPYRLAPADADAVAAYLASLRR